MIFQYHQTVSLHPHMHRTVWRTVLLKQNRAQTWPPWPKFATPFYANGFTFSSENLSDILQYHTLFKTHFWRFLKKLHCWVVGSYVVFRLPVSCAQFHCSSTFLHGIRQIPARFIKTVMFSCQNDSFMLFSWMWRMSPLTSITTAYYAVMRAWRNLLFVTVLRSNWSNALLIYRQLHHTTPKITRNIQGNPNLRLG